MGLTVELFVTRSRVEVFFSMQGRPPRRLSHFVDFPVDKALPHVLDDVAWAAIVMVANSLYAHRDGRAAAPR